MMASPNQQSPEGECSGLNIEDKFYLDYCYFRNFEYKSDFPLSGVEGRLSKCQEFWFNTLDCPLFVKSVIKFGYSLPLKSFPAAASFRNNCSALRHADFVQDAIHKLLKNRCILETTTTPHVVNPLTVAEGKKLRLVLDLRYVNQFLQNQTFKYEDLITLSEVFEGHFFFIFDLSSGYHHVSIVDFHQQLLGFSWIFPDGRKRYFVFRVLTFGLATACFLFTKLLRPLVGHWRSIYGTRVIGLYS